MQDWKITDKLERVEFVGLVNDGLEAVNLHGT